MNLLATCESQQDSHLIDRLIVYSRYLSHSTVLRRKIIGRNSFVFTLKQVINIQNINPPSLLTKENNPFEIKLFHYQHEFTHKKHWRTPLDSARSHWQHTWLVYICPLLRFLLLRWIRYEIIKCLFLVREERNGHRSSCLWAGQRTNGSFWRERRAFNVCASTWNFSAPLLLEATPKTPTTNGGWPNVCRCCREFSGTCL